MVNEVLVEFYVVLMIRLLVFGDYSFSIVYRNFKSAKIMKTHDGCCGCDDTNQQG